MLKKAVSASLYLLAVVLLAGCASEPQVYASGEATQRAKVVNATVVEVRETLLEHKERRGETISTRSGSMAGGVAGAGGGLTGVLAGAVAGAVVAPVAGALIDQQASTSRGIEIVYRVDGSTETKTLVQPLDPSNPIEPGMRIRLTQSLYSSKVEPLATGQ